MFSTSHSLTCYRFLFLTDLVPTANTWQVFLLAHMLWQHLILNQHLISIQTMNFRLRSHFSLFPRPSSAALKFYFRSFINFSHCSFFSFSCHVYPMLQGIIRKLIFAFANHSFDTLQTHSIKFCKTLTLYFAYTNFLSKCSYRSYTLKTIKLKKCQRFALTIQET